MTVTLHLILVEVVLGYDEWVWMKKTKQKCPSSLYRSLRAFKISMNPFCNWFGHLRLYRYVWIRDIRMTSTANEKQTSRSLRCLEDLSKSSVIKGKTPTSVFGNASVAATVWVRRWRMWILCLSNRNVCKKQTNKQTVTHVVTLNTWVTNGPAVRMCVSVAKLPRDVHWKKVPE